MFIHTLRVSSSLTQAACHEGCCAKMYRKVVITQYQCQVFIAVILISHSLAAPQIGGGAGAGAGGGGGAAGAGAGGGAVGAGGAAVGAGAGAGAASAAAGAAMMAAGTGMLMMNPMFPLFPLMLAGASFAKVTILSASLLLTPPLPGVLHRAPAGAPPRPPQTGRSPLPPPSRLPPPPPPASLPPVSVSSVPVLDTG